MRPYFVFLAATNAVFFQSIFFLYYQQDVGLSAPAILWLQSWALVVRASLDLPFGMLADRASRRRCLQATALMQLLGTAVLLARPTAAAAVVAETAFGIAAALRSGADSAFLYDSLHATGRDQLYPRSEGRAQALAAIASGAAALVGGAVAAFDMRLPYALSLLTAAVGVVAATRLDEPPHLTRHSAPAALVPAARRALATPRVRWSIALAAVAVTVSHVYFYLQQPFLDAIGTPIALFGVLFAATKLITAAVATTAHRIDDAVGERGAAVLMTLTPTVGLGAMAVASTPWAAPVILTRGILDGLWQPLLNVYMNRRVSSSERATMLSLQSVVARMTLALGLAALGTITRAGSIAIALAVAALASFIAGVALVTTARRR